MSYVSFDAEQLKRVMQERLDLLAAPAEGTEHEYLADRRFRARVLILLSLETVNRHVEEVARFLEHAASVSRDNITTFTNLTAAVEDATRELAKPKSAEVQSFERIAHDQLVQTARLAATVGRARALVLDWVSTTHDIEMGKHYAGLVDLMEVADPGRRQRVADAVAQAVVVQGTSIAIGVLILGPPGALAGTAFGLLVDAWSVAKAFKKDPGLARLGDGALRELDEFDLASMNWCIATELMLRRLRQVREQSEIPIDANDAQAAILARFGELVGA